MNNVIILLISFFRINKQKSTMDFKGSTIPQAHGIIYFDIKSIYLQYIFPVHLITEFNVI